MTTLHPYTKPPQNRSNQPEKFLISERQRNSERKRTEGQEQHKERVSTAEQQVMRSTGIPAG